MASKKKAAVVKPSAPPGEAQIRATHPKHRLTLTQCAAAVGMSAQSFHLHYMKTGLLVVVVHTAEDATERFQVGAKSTTTECLLYAMYQRAEMLRAKEASAARERREQLDAARRMLEGMS